MFIKAKTKGIISLVKLRIMANGHIILQIDNSISKGGVMFDVTCMI